ncbi:hypothetical protein JCM8097_007515 [Rhodosporidiobolus ruineniae]
MRRSSSAFLLATVAATAATLSSAAPLVASTSSAFDVEVDLTAGNWKMPAFFPVAPALERRGLGDDELVVLSASTSSDGASASIPVSASSSSGDDEVDADEDEGDSAVFDPSSSSADESKVIKNPKLVLNPKNPFYSSTLASISSARATRTAASSSSTTTPAAASTTTSGKGAAQTQNTWYLVPEAPSQSAATTSLVSSSSPAVTSTAPVTTTTTTTSASSSASSPAATTKVYSGGIATYFYQNGNPGNCGDYNQDTAMLVALPTKTYANGKYCGDWLTIKRVSTGQTIQAFVADSCPSCENNSSLDLSLAAFQALEPDLDVGIFDIEWWFNDA